MGDNKGTHVVQAPLNLGTADAAYLIGVSPKTLSEWRRHPGKGPDYIKLDHKVLYPVEGLRAFCDAHLVRRDGRGQ